MSEKTLFTDPERVLFARTSQPAGTYTDASETAEGRRFWALVRLGQRDRSLSRVDAIKAIVAEFPRAHLAMIEAANQVPRVEPLVARGPSTRTGDFEAEVKKLMAADYNMTKGTAIRAVADKHPELHDAYITKLRSDRAA